MANFEMRGADHIAKALRDNSIQVIFSLSGNQIMPVYDALFGTGIRIVHTRHEAAAVYMAEAAAQVSGDVGLVLLTAAPGFANGLSAMYTAHQSETPLVILTGDSPVFRDGRGAFQELDQCAAAAAMTKASFRATNAAGLYDDITRAINLAKSGRPGPVHLALPDDILRKSASADHAVAVLPPIPVPMLMPKGLTDEIACALRMSKAPLFLAGPTFCRPSLKPLLRKLSNQLNVPVVAFESPRGLKAPRLGAFAEMVGQADLVVTFGKPFDFMIGFGDTSVFNKTCKIIQIDAEAKVLAGDAQVHTERNLTQYCVDPTAVIEQLLATANIAKHNSQSWRQEFGAAIAYRPPAWQQKSSEETINSLAFARAIADFVAAKPETTLIIDGGEIGQWSQALADADVAIINGPSGAIGASIPYAIGAQMTRPNEPVLTVMGDGTAGFHIAEFETAVRENVPFIAVVGNDAKWNAEYQIQLRDYGQGRAWGCELTAARYDRIAAELGGYGEQVTMESQILPAINRALASGKPACINVMIDGQAAPVISRQNPSLGK